MLMRDMNKRREEWEKCIIERIEKEGRFLNSITAPDGIDLYKYGFRHHGKGKNEGTTRWISRRKDNEIKRDYYHRKHPLAKNYFKTAYI